MSPLLTRRFAPPTPVLSVAPEPYHPAAALLQELRESSLVLPKDWELLPRPVRDELARCSGTVELLSLLVAKGLLTEYLADRIGAGKTFGLLVGNYRVLDRLGAGGMGVVFRAEHVHLRRQVAIKMVAQAHAQPGTLLSRFTAEMQAVALLQHPNIVAAFDAGRLVNPDPQEPVVHYLVMEYLPWPDLEEHVLAHGPLDPAQACRLVDQLADALGVVHQHHLVHRDLKPSNVLVGPAGQAKLLDFGLVHHWCRRLTGRHTLLGTVEYMAPEQGNDAMSVDIRADIYGLGGILYWSLTGRAPFAAQGSLAEELARRFTQPAPAVRAERPELSPELEAVVARLLAPKREDRYATPEAVRRALQPFLGPAATDFLYTSLTPAAPDPPRTAEETEEVPRAHRVLLVDDDPCIRLACRQYLEADGHQCDEAATGVQALEAVIAQRYDLMLLDINLPEMTGWEVVRHLANAPPYPHLKIIVLSGCTVPEEMAQLLSAGAVDYLSKPISFEQMRARANAALRLKDAQDRSDRLNRSLLRANADLERHLTARDSDLVHARSALVLGLAKLVEHHDPETGAHLVRLQRYVRSLAEEAAGLPGLADQINPQFIQMLEYSVPLHDIGKVGLPDHILLKPGALEPAERLIMETHTVIGANTLRKVAQQHGAALGFLHMGIDIARHHHERYDGTGYPDRLAGSAIPLAARLVAVCDVYDTLRAQRPFRPALSHAAAVRVMIEESPGQFDPLLLQALERCAPQFEAIFRELPDGTDF
jgi:putative two-component system response regulator